MKQNVNKNANSAFKKISDRYNITDKDKQNLDVLEEWCSARKLPSNNGKLFPRAECDALSQSGTFTQGGACAEIKELLESVGMMKEAKAFVVKAPTLAIVPIHTEPLNLKNVNLTDDKVQEYDAKEEEGLNLLNTVKVWILAGYIDGAKAMLVKSNYPSADIENIIQGVYNEQVPILKNALKEAQQELEKEKNERTVKNNIDYGRRQEEFNISKYQNSVSEAQTKLDTLRMQYPQGRVEMYLEALDKLDDLQNANAKLQANMFDRIGNMFDRSGSKIAQSNQDISRHGTHINSIIDKEKETDQSYTNLQDAARERFMKKREEAEVQQQKFGAKNSTPSPNQR